MRHSHTTQYTHQWSRKTQSIYGLNNQSPLHCLRKLLFNKRKIQKEVMLNKKNI